MTRSVLCQPLLACQHHLWGYNMSQCIWMKKKTSLNRLKYPCRKTSFRSVYLTREVSVNKCGCQLFVLWQTFTALFHSHKMCVYSHHPLKSPGGFFIILFGFTMGSFSKITAGATCLITAHMTKGGKNIHFISLKMSQYYFNCTSASPRIPSHTSSSCVGGMDVRSWIVWENVTGDR